MSLDDLDTAPAVAPPRPSINLPSALRPRAEDDNLAIRADALVAAMAPYADIARLDGRFLHSLGYMADAVRSVAGLRANEFAPDACDSLTNVLADMVASAESAVAQIQPDLEFERKGRPSRGGDKLQRKRSAAA